MTQIGVICQALIKGRVLSQMDGFKEFACTNISREISRSVEQKFGVSVERIRVDYTSKYGHTGIYFKYKLDVLKEENLKGVELMKQYIEDNGGVVVVVEKNRVGRPTNESKIITNQQTLL